MKSEGSPLVRISSGGYPEKQFGPVVSRQKRQEFISGNIWFQVFMYLGSSLARLRFQYLKSLPAYWTILRMKKRSNGNNVSPLLSPTPGPIADLAGQDAAQRGEAGQASRGRAKRVEGHRRVYLDLQNIQDETSYRLFGSTNKGHSV